jgi:hypothetical protein
MAAQHDDAHCGAAPGPEPAPALPAPASLDGLGLAARLAMLRGRVAVGAANTPGAGRCLRAARAFAAGEAIFEEPALLCASAAFCSALRLEVAVARKRAAGDFATRGRPVAFPPAAPLLARGGPGGAVVSAAFADRPRALERCLRDLHPLPLPAPAPAPATARPCGVEDNDAGGADSDGDGGGDGGGDGDGAELTTGRLADVLACNCAEANLGDAPVAALYLVLSMVNHACAPSAAWASSWSAAARAPVATVFAQRALAAGEELYFAYAAVDLPRAARAAGLRGWGFECCCPARCAAPHCDAALLRCARGGCGGAVAVGDDACGVCGAGGTGAVEGEGEGAGAGAAKGAARAREDALFWLRADGAGGDGSADAVRTAHAAARRALSLLHPRDCGLRAEAAGVAADVVAAFCGECERGGADVGGGGSGIAPPPPPPPCACLAQLALELATAVRVGARDCAYLPLPARALAALLEAEAACAAAGSARACGREGCGGGAGAARAGAGAGAGALALAAAAEAFLDVAAAARVAGVCADAEAAGAWQALFAAAAAAPPATPLALATLRAARRGLTAAAAARSVAGVDDEARIRLWGR